MEDYTIDRERDRQYVNLLNQLDRLAPETLHRLLLKLEFYILAAFIKRRCATDLPLFKIILLMQEELTPTNQ